MGVRLQGEPDVLWVDHTHTHYTHAHMHTCMHARTRARTHARTQARTHTRALTHPRARAYTHPRPHPHMRTQGRMQASGHAGAHLGEPNAVSASVCLGLRV